VATCRVGGHVVNAQNKQECDDQGGDWTPDQPPRSGGCHCIVKGNDILEDTPMGRRYIATYEEYFDRDHSIWHGDYRLIQTTVKALTFLEPFIDAMWKTQRGRAEGLPEQRLMAGVHALGKEVFAVLRHGISDERALEALNVLERDYDRFKGTTPREALELLRSAPGQMS
jgi:hypothetical protein